MGRLASANKMSLFKKRQPEENPQLAALRAREKELVLKQVTLQSEYLDTPDPRDANQILREIDDLNAQIGVVRHEIEEFPT